jgi:hypothetical protein
MDSHLLPLCFANCCRGYSCVRAYGWNCTQGHVHHSTDSNCMHAYIHTRHIEKNMNWYYIQCMTLSNILFLVEWEHLVMIHFTLFIWMNECYQMRRTIDGMHRPRSLVQGGYTSLKVARIQSQLIASWVGEGKTTANSLPNSSHRSFQSVDGACRGSGWLVF